MLKVKVGSGRMPRPSILRYWRFITLALSLAAFSTFILHKYSELFNSSGDKAAASERLRMENKPVNPCPVLFCEGEQFSFFIQSGAASVVPPRICFNNQLVLGALNGNTGTGINVAIFDGRAGTLIKTGFYDMYSGDVAPLINLLKEIEDGSIVLMASYDEPASKLNEEARTLILDLGSSSVKSLGFRDNWIFAGGKGAKVQSTFEKHLKNEPGKNKYGAWPELIDMSGCIPRYVG